LLAIASALPIGRDFFLAAVAVRDCGERINRALPYFGSLPLICDFFSPSALIETIAMLENSEALLQTL
jgi:hypothetical protein